MRDALLQEHRTAWPIAIQCQVPQVSRSGYNEWRGRPLSERANRRASLTVKVRKIHAASRETSGSPRVHRDLRASGEVVNEKTVAKVMREAGIRSKSSRKFRVTRPIRITPSRWPRTF